MIRDKQGYFKLGALLTLIFISTIISIVSEKLYKQDYDRIAPQCDAGLPCPLMFRILGVVSGTFPFITAFLTLTFFLRLYSVISEYTKKIAKYFDVKTKEGGDKNE